MWWVAVKHWPDYCGNNFNRADCIQQTPYTAFFFKDEDQIKTWISLKSAKNKLNERPRAGPGVTTVFTFSHL